MSSPKQRDVPMPDAQLAVVPGAPHGLPIERDFVARLVLDLLADHLDNAWLATLRNAVAHGKR